MTGELIRTDICILGAGSGGLSVAAGAAQMGARVVLLEGGEMGGDCLNTGCVPSKALLAAAAQAQAFRTGAKFGIAPQEPQVDFAAVMDHVRRSIATIAPNDSVERFEGFGVRVLREYGQFISAREVRAGTATIRARRFVIATGSSPMVPPVPGLDTVPYLTNETIFELREMPRHLIVLGGGPIGLEMAQAFRRLGARVTVIEAARALGREDPETAAIALATLRGEGLEILEDCCADAVRAEQGGIVVETQTGEIAGSHLLVAAGRKPTVHGLGLEAAGIACGPRGITVDAGLRTSNRKVYAIGDVIGAMQFTHVAGYHAGVVIRSAVLGLPAKAATAHIPWATFTDPEIAHVGLTEAQAREEYGNAVEVIRVPFHDIDRAVASGREDGLLKLVICKRRPVGASVVGAQADELIQLWALAIASRLKLASVAGMVSPYPTLGEINKRAAGQYFAPRLFESAAVKRIVGMVQRFLP